MKNIISSRAWGAVTGSVMVVSSTLVHAQGLPVEKSAAQRMEALEQLVVEQGRQLDAMRQQLREQTARQQEL
jgi:hypothetical protein